MTGFFNFYACRDVARRVSTKLCLFAGCNQQIQHLDG